jgi:hypothetical protein
MGATRRKETSEYNGKIVFERFIVWLRFSAVSEAAEWRILQEQISR